MWVRGIGTATATEIVIATNEMKAITDPKKMACHAGVARFTYQSGSSVRGRPSVSQHARKRLKSLFHLGAMAAIRAKGELQDYYQRKVKEGKIGSPKRQNAVLECGSQQTHPSSLCGGGTGRKIGQKLCVTTCINHRNRTVKPVTWRAELDELLTFRSFSYPILFLR